MSKPIVKSFFETNTNTWSFVVEDEATKKCAIIDSVMIYKANSATTSSEFADSIIKYVKERGLTVEWILETHAHADHISGILQPIIYKFLKFVSLQTTKNYLLS